MRRFDPDPRLQIFQLPRSHSRQKSSSPIFSACLQCPSINLAGSKLTAAHRRALRLKTNFSSIYNQNNIPQPPRPFCNGLYSASSLNGRGLTTRCPASDSFRLRTFAPFARLGYSTGVAMGG